MRVVAATLLVLTVVGSAHAYVRSRARSSGKPLSWGTRCLSVVADSRGSQDVDIDLIDETLQRAVHNWSDQLLGCSTIELTARPHDGPRGLAVDQQSILTFNDTWESEDGRERSPSAFAVTRVLHVSAPDSPADGLILDADIELNNRHHTFITDPSQMARPDTDVADLEGTLTHELGHLLGLSHTCWDEVGEQPYDHNGDPVPSCERPPEPLSTTILDATMYPFAVAGSIEQRSLTDDDILGICEVYPNVVEPAACYPRITSGCAMTGRDNPTGWLWLLLAIGLRSWWRRRLADRQKIRCPAARYRARPSSAA